MTEDEALQLIGEKIKVPARAMPTQYQVTERNLFWKYYARLKHINKFAPQNLRFQLPRLPTDSRPEKIQKEVEKIINSTNSRMAKLFPTTGHINLEAYEAAVRNSGNQTLIDNFELLKNVDFDLSIRRPNAGRFWVPKTGFQNLFVTKSSRGYYTPEGRNNVESGWTGIEAQEYLSYDDETKPKYGSIRPKLSDSKSIPAEKDKGYGDDIYLLKKEAVIHRLTLNIGDSNGVIAINTGSGWEWRRHEAKEWDQTYIPWSHRTLLAPYLNRELFGHSQKNETDILNKGWKTGFVYFEIQIFGALTLDDVEAFEFQGTPPSGEFLKELQKRKIQIIDGRNNQRKIWTP